MTHISAPGKLFIAGEWAVLEKGNPGIVAAVNKRVHALVEPSQEEGISVTIDDFNIRDLRFTYTDAKLQLIPSHKVDDDKIKFLRASLETALQYAQEKKIASKPFHIRTWGDESQITVGKEVRKIGFGSSAASVVAIIKAVLDFHGVRVSPMELYKLACITHYFAQGKIGSGFDVAASTFGGVFLYKRFDEDWLIACVKKGQSLTQLLDREWPFLEVQPLAIPKDMHLDVCWTLTSASTTQLVTTFKAWAQSHKDECQAEYDKIARLVRELLPAWKKDDKTQILELIRKNHNLLAAMGEKAGVGINTDGLQKLADIANQAGGAGKLSGAGGGDCGIAISFSKDASEHIRKAWKNAHLYPIDTTIDHKGAIAESSRKR